MFLGRIALLLNIIGLSLFAGIGPEWTERSRLPHDLVSSSSWFNSSPFLSSQDFSEALSFPEVKWVSQTGHSRNDLIATMDGGKPLLVPGEPKLAFYQRQYHVPFGYRAEVELNGIVMEETTAAVPLTIIPPPYQWSETPKLSFAKLPEGRFFPGQLFRSTQVADQLRVSLYPLQWDRFTGKVMRVKSAELSVRYVADSRSFIDKDLMGEILGTTSVILTTEALRSAAEALQTFHQREFGVESQVLTVEEIDRLETPVDEADLPEGYKTMEGRDESILRYNPISKTGYHYQLARKIVQYFQRRMNGNLLRSVTILGNAEQVPPSYYFGVSTGFGRNFTPTDRCYGAQSKCLVPRLAVGRLPFSNHGELSAYLNKVSNWLGYSRISPSEVSLFGGRAFSASDVYVGELSALNILKNGADWRGVQKYFRSKQNFTKAHLLDMVAGRHSSSQVYFVDHGDGNRWFIDTQKRIYVTSNEILNTSLSTNGVTPVVVALSCTNAAFDETLSLDRLFGDRPAEGTISIGVALLKSQAGAVAYVGAARPSVGQPIYRFDSRGNLQMEGTTYSLKLSETIFARYAQRRSGNLGQFFLAASQEYLSESLMRPEDQWTYFITSLLGDPLLTLPDRREGVVSGPLGSSTYQLDDSFGFGIPVLHFYRETDVKFTFHSDWPVLATLYRILTRGRGIYDNEEAIYSGAFAPGDHVIPLRLTETKGEGPYFLRLENSQGVPVERQIMFRAAKDQD